MPPYVIPIGADPVTYTGPVAQPSLIVRYSWVVWALGGAAILALTIASQRKR